MSETQPLLYDQKGHQQPPSAYPDGYNNPPQETPVNYEPPPAYYYPQGEPNPPAPQVHETVVVVYNTLSGFTESPVSMRCPNCQTDVLTITHYQIGRTTWLKVLMWFLLGLLFHLAWWFCWIPCCMSNIT